MELPNDVHERINWAIDHLASEFEGQFDRDQISRLVNDSARRR